MERSSGSLHWGCCLHPLQHAMTSHEFAETASFSSFWFWSSLHTHMLHPYPFVVSDFLSSTNVWGRTWSDRSLFKGAGGPSKQVPYVSLPSVHTGLLGFRSAVTAVLGWCLLLQIQILAKESNQYAKSDIRRLSPKPTVHCSKQPAWPWQNPKHPTTGQQHCEVATNRFRRLTFGLPAELSVEAAFEASNALKLLEWETRSKAWLFPKSEVTVCTSRGSKQAKMGCCSPPPCLQAHLRLQPSPSVNCDAIQEHRAILWSWRITTPNTLKNQWKRVSGTGALLAMSAIGTNPFASRNSASPLAWAGTLWHMRSTPSPLDHRNFPQQLHPLRPQRRKCRLLLDICKLQNLRASLCSVPGHGRIRKIRQVLSVKDQEEDLFARTLLETQPEIPSLIGTNRQAYEASMLSGGSVIFGLCPLVHVVLIIQHGVVLLTAASGPNMSESEAIEGCTSDDNGPSRAVRGARWCSPSDTNDENSENPVLCSFVF